jgi:AcrR family transcriptional regulator
MMMSEKSQAIEEKIIQAAIDCIEKYGLSGTTSRRIAEMAGVNGAAINYYFRSKEVLVEKCMQVTLNNAFDLQDFERIPEGSPQERLAAILNHFILGACTFPGLTHAHFHDLFAEGKFDPLVMEKMDAYLSALTNDLKESGSQLDEENLHLAVAQSFAATLMMALSPQLFEKCFGFDLHDEETRKQFVKRLVEKLL